MTNQPPPSIPFTLLLEPLWEWELYEAVLTVIEKAWKGQCTAGDGSDCNGVSSLCALYCVCQVLYAYVRAECV